MTKKILQKHTSICEKITREGIMKSLTGKFCYKVCDYIYDGEYDSIEDLKKDHGNDDFDMSNVGVFGERLNNLVTGRDLTEYIEEYNYDNHSVFFEESYFSYCHGNVGELANRLEEVMCEFFKKHPIEYYKVIPWAEYNKKEI